MKRYQWRKTNYEKNLWGIWDDVKRGYVLVSVIKDRELKDMCSIEFEQLPDLGENVVGIWDDVSMTYQIINLCNVNGRPE